MAPLSSKKYFVYLLALDRYCQHIFYVGKGTGNRPSNHAGEARAQNLTLKCAVIRFLHRNDKTYRIRIAYETDDEKLAYWHEMKTITSYPPECLTNIITGYRKPEYEVKLVDYGSGFQGYLIHTKTGEVVGSASATFEQTVRRHIARMYDGIVLPSYFETIGYEIPSYFPRKPGM